MTERKGPVPMAELLANREYYLDLSRKPFQGVCACGRSRNHRATMCGTCRTARVRAQDDKILSLWHQGLTKKEIAREVGLALSSVYRRVDAMARMGIVFPPRKPGRA